MRCKIPTVDYSTDIRRTDPHRHKYYDAVAEYVDTIRGTNGDLDYRGDVNCPTGAWARVNARRVIFHDSRGFVWVERYATEAHADAVMDALERYYAAWSWDEWDDDYTDHDGNVWAWSYDDDVAMWDAQRAALDDMERADGRMEYVVSVPRGQYVATWDEWRAMGEPRRYSGGQRR